MLVVKIGRNSKKTTLTKIAKSVFTATCNILALCRAVLPINDVIMCTDFLFLVYIDGLGSVKFPTMRVKEGQRDKVPDPMMRCGAHYCSWGK